MSESTEMRDQGTWYNESPMRAIDLYSGVGGWTLGLRMAGVKVVRSYEWWQEANATHNANFGTDHAVVDIRKLALRDLDQLGQIDIVVGSPPCTQFSFANRGGSGDIQDGLVDIRKFLEIVAYLRPRFWAMENVPRVAGILRQQLEVGGQLHQYEKLVKVIEVVDSADFGVPQNRRRMIAGNFPRDLFFRYKQDAPRKTLGDVIRGLAQRPVTDPVYGFRLSRKKLTGHTPEAPLSPEERRLNEEAKRYHPIYNLMQFPDQFDRPSRTVTATCTRVSRESIVIKDPKTEVYRRLTVRERASVQSFPTTFQFFGKSYASRQRMAGNAVPPLLTYFIACSMRKRRPQKALKIPKSASQIHPLPRELALPVKMDTAGKNYSPTRGFRAAIQGLRFGSGVRFELSNRANPTDAGWGVGFYFGPSKAIRTICLDKPLEQELLACLDVTLRREIRNILDGAADIMPERGHEELQLAWARREKGRSPFELADSISELSRKVERALAERDEECRILIKTAISTRSPGAIPPKILKNAVTMTAGLLVGSRVNSLWPPVRQRTIGNASEFALA